MTFTYYLIISLILNTIISAPNYENRVLILGEDLNDVIKENEDILIDFYAPWCKHCQILAPQFERAAKILSEEEPPILLAKVDV